MRTVIAALVVIAASMAAAHAEVDLNPPFGDPSYAAFTVFSPDAPGPEAVGRDVLVFFHGLNSAIPNGTFKRLRDTFRQSHTVIGINYEPLDLARSLAFLDGVAETWLAGRRVVAVGTSFGGLWANFIGHRIGAEKIVLLNPVADPVRQLRSYVGRRGTNERRARSVLIEATMLEPYGALEIVERPGIARLVVLAADDDLLDFRVALQAYAGTDETTVMVFPEGGHTIDLRRHPARAVIVTFIKGQ